MRRMSPAIRTLLTSAALLALASCDGIQADPVDPTVDAASVDAATPTCSVPIEGCSCTVEGQTQECWPDALVENGARVCLVGEQTCTGGVWSACEDVHRLVGEDGRDVVIEAASDDPAQCASCEPRCFRAIDTIRSTDVAEHGTGGLVFNPAVGHAGAENPGMFITCSDPSCATMSSIGRGTGTPWSPNPLNSDGVTVDPSDGALVLGVLGLNSPGVWVANMNDGTLSRLDPATGREIGRYVSARPDAVNRARPATEYCNWSNTGNCPSRTAVDQNFDCYVANRAFGRQGTVTKIAADPRRCIDRNANGRIDTSTDRNGDGRINMGDPTEFFGVNDECILWTVPVGVNNGVPRALAIGVAPAGVDVGDVWVGNYNEARAYRLRPSDGAALGNVSMCVGGNCNYPYGAAVDARGRVFFWARMGGTQRVFGYVTPSTGTYTWTSNSPYYYPVGYGMTYYVNADGSQEYFFNADSDGGYINRYNVLNNTWMYIRSPGTPRGMAADINGNVYAAGWSTGYGWGGSCNNRLWRYSVGDTATFSATTLQTWTAPTASCFMGVGVTFDNAVWLIGAGNNRGARLAPDRGSWIESPQVFVGPYTYSDFIGYGLNVFANPRGHYSFVTDAGDGCDMRWQTATWDAMVPVGTSVEIWVRSANTTAALSTGTWIGPFRTSPANLTVAPGPVPNGRYLEMDIRMETTDRRLTPRVYSAAATGYCDHMEFGTGGTYTRLYNSTMTEDAATPSVICDPLTEFPIWGEFTWDATLPAGTSITLEFRAGRDATSAHAASPVTYTILPSSVPPIPSITALFVMAGRMNTEIQQPFMEVRAILNSSSDRRRTPTLRTFSLEFSCMPGA
ncbi:MAG: SBBP repeat-containing protein [Sandaracinus sp.]